MDPGEMFGYFFSFGVDVLSSELSGATNVIKLQTGDATKQTVESSGVEIWQQPGFASMPANPTAGQAGCQAIVLKRSDYDIALALRDTRAAKIYGGLKPGEACAYSTGPDGKSQGRTLWKADGSTTTLATSDNTESGQTLSWSFGPDGLHIVTPWGGISLDSIGITLTTGQAALTLTPAGVAKLMGTQVSVQGSVCLVSGDLATCLGPRSVPTPNLPNPTSCMTGLVGTAAKPSTNVFVSV